MVCTDADQKRKLAQCSNRLSLIAPAGSKLDLTIARSFDLHGALGKGKLAMGEPETVPLGRYSRYALISLGVWNAVGERLAKQGNPRNVISAVAEGTAPLGIAFETDALLDKRVRIVDVFPADSHPPISYLMAATPGAQDGSGRFMEFLRSNSSRAVFQRYGFRPAQ